MFPHLSFFFYLQNRSSVLASICDCYTCCYDCQPSYDICNVLLHKAGYGSWLLSEDQNNPYLQESHGSDLHTCDELVSHDHVHHHRGHFQEYERYCQCIWSVFLFLRNLQQYLSCFRIRIFDKLLWQ